MASRNTSRSSAHRGDAKPLTASALGTGTSATPRALDAMSEDRSAENRMETGALAAIRPLDVPMLDPQVLSALTAASVRDILLQGQSPNTRASYATATRYWGAWYAARYGQPLSLPVPVPVVLQFIADHAERLDASNEPDATSRRPARLVHDLPTAIDELLVARQFKGKLGALSLNTLAHRISVLSKAHQLSNVDNPCAYPAVRELLRKVRIGYARRQIRPRQQEALTRDHLEAVLKTCDDSPVGVRDRALLLFAWASGGRRRSEVATATVENMQNHGDRGFVYLLGQSKSDQEGRAIESIRKPIAGRAATAMTAWLKLSGITSGPIFRRILKSGRILDEPLAPRAVRSIVMNRTQLAGLSGHYSAHSLRSGFVTEAGRQQMPPAEAMKMTGHKNWAVFMGYYRAGDLLNSQTARMLEDPAA